MIATLVEAVAKLRSQFNEQKALGYIKGDKGDQGYKGEDGKDGINGKDGIDGKDGKDGIDGIDGVDGIDGKNGRDGLRGFTGKDGLNGLNGTDGKDGEKGDKGDKGDKPNHEWKGTKLKFELPSGEWGKEIDLAGKDGLSRFLGGSTGVQSLTSTGNTVQITQDGTTFNLETTGGGGGLTEITSADGSIVVTQAGTVANIQVSEASPASTVLAQVRNNTGATLTKGTVVYINGAVGNKATVAKALGNADATSAQTLGLITADLAHNGNGYVTVMGQLVGLNTSAFTEGDQLYLSGTVAGAYTATKPLAPKHLVYIGVVTRSHVNFGAIEVKVQNGYELYEIHDVSITTPANGNVLTYDSATSLWKNLSVATALGYTPYNATNPNGYTTNTGTVTSVTATSPVTSTGGATPVIAMPAATTSVSGYLTSTDWNTFNGKYSTGGALGTPSSGTLTNCTSLPIGGITATGTPSSTTYLRGDGTWSTVSGGGGSGTVTSVSVVSANGFTGTVANATTTPAITLTTSVTGLLKGNGTAISAATSGTDYAPATSGTAILYGNGAGGFSNVTIGTNLTFTGGTLNATGGGGGGASGFEQTFLLMGA